MIQTTPSIYAREFNGANRHWSGHVDDNKTFLKAQEQWCNDRLNAIGHLFLNEIYDMLGFDRTSAGAVVGWFKQSGSNPIDFKIVGETPLGEMLVDFNPDGVIYDKLDGRVPEVEAAFQPRIMRAKPYSISRQLLARMVAAHTSGMFNAIPEQADFELADQMIALLEAKLAE